LLTQALRENLFEKYFFARAGEGRSRESALLLFLHELFERLKLHQESAIDLRRWMFE